MKKTNRILLDESQRLFAPNQITDKNIKNNSNGKKIKQLPLLELDGKTGSLKEAKHNKDIPIYLKGPIQAGDCMNKNYRIYPWDILKEKCEAYMGLFGKDMSYGELDHPEDSNTPSLNNASHLIEDMWFDDKEKIVYGLIKVLNAYMPDSAPGLKARGIMLNGGKIGISSRALGSVEEMDDHYLVLDDLDFICWDLVSNPSTHVAILKPQLSANRLSENFNRVKQNKILLTESQIFGSKNIDIKNKLIENASKPLTRIEKHCLNKLGVERFLQLRNL